MASVDQGASQARRNEASFKRGASFDSNKGATLDRRPTTRAANYSTGLGASTASHQATQAANYSTGFGASATSSRPTASGTYETGMGRSGDRSDTFVFQGKRDGVIQTYILRRFLGWNGSTPVRWTSAINAPPQPGLTNITVEDEFVVRVPVSGFSPFQARKLLR